MRQGISTKTKSFAMRAEDCYRLDRRVVDVSELGLVARIVALEEHRRRVQWSVSHIRNAKVG
jgi:gamma-glutamylcysteine synthetase